MEAEALKNSLAEAFRSRFGAASPSPESNLERGVVERKRQRSSSAEPHTADLPMVGVGQRSTLSTGPAAPRTHWHQSLFFLRELVHGGAFVDATFRVSLDTGARGWVTLEVEQEVVNEIARRDAGISLNAADDSADESMVGTPTPPRRQRQSWLLRSY